MGPRNFSHAFDGFSKIHTWKFYGNGSASFSTNFVRSFVYNNSMKMDNIDNYITFQKPRPPFSSIQGELSLLKGMDNMNVNVYSFSNSDLGISEYVTLSDAWKLYQIDPLTVDTIGPVNAEKPSSTEGFISLMSSAHPVAEFRTGHHFTFLTSVSAIPGVPSHLTLIRIKSAFNREVVAKWNVDKAPYMHAFSVTPNYVVLFAAPYHVSPPKLLTNFDAYSGLVWSPDEKSYFYVVEIKTGKVTTFATDIRNPTHHVNAYEEGGKIVMDIITTPDPYFVVAFEIEIIRDVNKRNKAGFSPELSRYTIDLQTNTLVNTKFPTNPQYPFINLFDIPAINEKYRHLKYCFVYGVSFYMDFKNFAKTALIKKDVCGSNDKVWHTDGHYPLEMWFVPTPNSTREDDGVLLTPVLHGEKKESYLLMLNATTMQEMNRAYLKTIVPFTIHGKFFEDLV